MPSQDRIGCSVFEVHFVGVNRWNLLRWKLALNPIANCHWTASYLTKSKLNSQANDVGELGNSDLLGRAVADLTSASAGNDHARRCSIGLIDLEGTDFGPDTLANLHAIRTIWKQASLLDEQVLNSADRAVLRTETVVVVAVDRAFLKAATMLTACGADLVLANDQSLDKISRKIIDQAPVFPQAAHPWLSELKY